MSLRRLAAKNVWQKRGRYLAYLGSSSFSVMIYFLYTSLALHPHLQGGYRGADFVTEGMTAAAVVIAIFTLLFLLYSGAAFIRSRMKEFGLFTLLGLTRRQLIRMILWENVIIAATAIAIGLGFGLLFLKLFFMVISLLLQFPTQLPVYVGWPVWRQTLLVFGSIFLLVSLLSLRGVLRRNIIELIRAGRTPQATPTFSRWRALLGVALIVVGYAWASHPNPVLIGLGVVPVTTMVSIGTYYALREASVAFLNLLKRVRHFYHRPGPFLTVSQLTFKLQENYRVLSATAILVAVILSAMGTIVTFYIIGEETALVSTPQAIQLNIPNGDSAAEHIAFVTQTLEDHGVRNLQLVEWRLPRASLGQTVTVVPYSLYTTLYRPQGETLLLESDEHAIQVSSFTVWGEPEPDRKPRLRAVEIGGTAYELWVSEDETGRLLNDHEIVLVLSDARFEQLVHDHPEAEFRTVAIWTGREWRQRGLAHAVTTLRSRYPDMMELTTTLETYQAGVATFGLALFIGVFISLVFFAATCSLLYFRLFTEIDEDRRYYTRLRQLGLSVGELRGLSRVQAMVLFLVPFLVGLMHSTFAMQALGTLAMRSVLLYGWMVALGYLVLYVGFFIVTYALYWKSMGFGRSETATV